MSDTRERMQEVGRAVETIIPPGTGFVVLAFDFDKPGNAPSGRLDYVANAGRADVCRMMIDFIKRSAEHFGEHELERLLTTHIEVDESERQMILLALAEMAQKNPGRVLQLVEISRKCDGVDLFEKFVRLTRAGLPVELPPAT